MLGASLLVFSFLAPPLAGPAASLRFETGRHTATVRDVARDPLSGDWITVGDDKAVRRWHGGKAAGPPLRFASSALGNGAFASCDVSSKGRLAVGDADRRGPSIWLYDLKQGAAGSVQRIWLPVAKEDNPTTAFVSLAFSPKGDLVAVGDDAGTVRICDVAKAKIVGTRKLDPSGSHSVFGLAFSPVGDRLAYAMADNQGANANDQKGTVGILDASVDLKPLSSVVLDHRALCLDWHDANAIMVGGSAGKLDLWQPGSAAATPLKTDLTFRTAEQEVTGVTRSADGKTTVAGTILGDLLVYANGASSPKSVRTLPRFSKVSALELAPGGKSVLVAHRNGEVYELAIGGDKPQVLSPGNPEVTEVRWSADGRALRWKRDGVPTGFDLAQTLPTVDRAVVPETGRRLNGATLSFEGNVVKVEGVPGFTSIVERATVNDAAFLDETHILVATEIGLRVFKGPQDDPRFTTFDGAGPTSVAVSPDRARVAVGFGDGLVRIYAANAVGAEPLVSLFVGAGEWVAWQEKTGYYDSSVGGDSIFGFQVNRGDSELATFVPAVMKEREFRKPGLLPRIFGGSAAALPPAPSVALATAITEVPAFAVVGVEGAQRTDGAWEVEGDTATVKVRVQNRTGGQKVSVRVGHGTSRDIPGLLDVPNPDGSVKSCTVSGLAPGPNLVRVYLGGEPLPGSEFTIVNTKAGADLPERIVVLGIGVGEYSNAEMSQRNLRYATKDAEGFVATVQECALGETVVKLVKDKEATRAGILDAVRWLQATAKPGDRVMVFIASHGVRTDEATYITPSDYAISNPKGTGIAWPALTEELAKVSGKSLVLFTDNCRSGAAVASARLDQSKAMASATLEMRGLVSEMSVFAACDASQESFEDASLGHGLFTYALLKGLRGEIPGQASPRSGIVTVDALKASLPEYLKEVNKTGATQTPRIMVPDWPIPVSKKPTKEGR